MMTDDPPLPSHPHQSKRRSRDVHSPSQNAALAYPSPVTSPLLPSTPQFASLASTSHSTHSHSTQASQSQSQSSGSRRSAGERETSSSRRSSGLPTILPGQLDIPPFNPHPPSSTSSHGSKRRSHHGSSNPPSAVTYAAPEVSTAHAKGLPAHLAPRPASTTVVPNPVSSSSLAYPLTPDQSLGGSAATFMQHPQVHPTTVSGAGRPHRASHNVTTTSSHAYVGQGQPMALPPQAGKRPVYFGQYLLLQTLGEGEFGKVKLGVHAERWGEEVAIKLIKRGSVQESTARMTKVSREIEVLRMVKHPYIVRLYDVIETEKYIGIVLEYASGGELFDHILAHRYLKERDACKLFAQLISGVAYLHAKKVVHRDLKLENLLLDRNRNIIITDFGFANRFGDRTDDLMATSCGSPCYAAPELVVQDGRYVGTAVDVWSCGVILYAMLAGYLPFDDDPANPDGDNINLLYKYIINTPLSFPDWIGPEPRDLLLRMLVPDPLRRATLEQVAAHRWLSRYTGLLTLSVEQQEEAAHNTELAKREGLARQRQAYDQTVAPPLARSQSTAIPIRATPAAPLMAPSLSVDAPVPHHPHASDRRAHAQSAVISPTSAFSPPMDAFAHAPTPSPLVPQPTDAEVEAARRRKAQANRYTVQLEYVGPASSPSGPETRSRTAAKRRAPTTPEPEMAAPLPPPLEMSELPVPMDVDSPTEMAPPQSPPRVSPPTIAAPEPTVVENVTPPSPQRKELQRAMEPEPVTPVTASSVVPSPPVTPNKATETVPFPSPNATPRAPKGSANSLASSVAPESQQPSPRDRTRPPSSASTRANRHKKGLSSDRFFLTRLLGSSGSSSSLDKAERVPPNSNGVPTASATTSLAYSPSGRPRTASAIRASDQAVKELNQPTDEVLDEVTNKRKGARRKALSLVVEPFSAKSSPSKTKKRETVAIEAAERPRTRSSVQVTSPNATPRKNTTIMAPPTTARPATAGARAAPPTVAPLPSLPSTAFDHQWAGPQPGKAKRVMDWFRWRSLPRDNTPDVLPPPISTDFDRPLPSPNSSATTVVPNGSSVHVHAKAPTVVVTNAVPEEHYDSGPSSRSASGAQSDLSEITAATTVTNGSSAALPMKVTTMAPPPLIKPIVTEPFNEGRLRFHQGAVDQEAITSRPPPAVVIDIRKALAEMGLDVREEAGPFRLKCVRRSQKKVAAQYGVPVNLLHSPSHNGASTPSLLMSANSGFGPASSERLPANGGLSASPSSTFKAFFSRRGSSNSVSQTSSLGHGNVLGPAGMPSPSLTISSLNFDSPLTDSLASPLTRTASSFGPISPVPFYGEGDTGNEVRFSVEVSRMKNLSGLYSVDIRRLKGDLWAYRGIYKTFLDRLDLQ